MNKVLKIIIIFVVSIILIISISFINHKITLNKEAREIKQIGKEVYVNNHKMNVYSEGNGDITLVFMSGGGTSSPVLDFKGLYSKLSNKYRIAVVEKAGYGFSEVADITRDIDTILNETREALNLAGEKGPYILIPHSMSGLEAIYWAQKYPSEVKGIIGLDPAIPEAYEYFKLPSKFTLSLVSFGARIGITRFFPSIVNSSSAIKENRLTEEEKEIYRAVFYKSTQTKNMNEEAKQVKANAKKVDDGGIPNTIPMYFFISNGKEVGMNNWSDILTGYTSNLDDGQYMELNCGHYLHNYYPEIIAEESIKFIEKIINN